MRRTLVVLLVDGKPVFAIVVEVQLGRKERKRFTRKAFQMLPQGYQFQSETIRNSIEKGRAAEKAADVLEVLDARGLAVTSEQRDRVLACTDIETLKRWLRAAATVASASELFER
jgi:hypothetical protein